MIVTGGGSIAAGTAFVHWTGSQAAALHTLEQYSIGGAVWYAITACWLTFPVSPFRRVTRSRS